MIRHGALRLFPLPTRPGFRGEETYLAQITSGGFDTLFINLNFADSAGLAKVLPAAQQAGLGVNSREAYLKGALFKMGAEAGDGDHSKLIKQFQMCVSGWGWQWGLTEATNSRSGTIPGAGQGCSHMGNVGLNKKWNVYER